MQNEFFTLKLFSKMSNQILLLASKYSPESKFSLLSSIPFLSMAILDLQKTFDFELLKFLCRFPNDAIKYLYELNIPNVNGEILDFILNDPTFRRSLHRIRKFSMNHSNLISNKDYHKIISFLPDDCDIYLNCPMNVESKNIREIGCHNFDEVSKYKKLEILHYFNSSLMFFPSFHLCRFLNLKHLIFKNSYNNIFAFRNNSIKPAISKLESVHAPEFEDHNYNGNIQMPNFRDLSLYCKGYSRDIIFFNPLKCKFGKFIHDGKTIHDRVISLEINSEGSLDFCKFFPNLFSLTIRGDNYDFVFPNSLSELYITEPNHNFFDRKAKNEFHQLKRISVIINGYFDMEKITDVEIIQITGNGKIELGKCKCKKLFYSSEIEINKTNECTTELIQI